MRLASPTETTDHILTRLIHDVLTECLDADEYALTETAREVVDKLRRESWVRGPAERRRAIKRFHRKEATA